MSSPGRGSPTLRTVRNGAVSDSVSRYIDEDISWLERAGRLLALAEEETMPLAERVALLAMAGRSVDEFFQLRGARLRASAALQPTKGRAIRVRVEELAHREARLLGRMITLLSVEGTAITEWRALDRAQKQQMREVFRERFLPAIAPLVSEPRQALPEPATLSLNLAVALTDTDGESRFGTIELPPVLERFVAVPEGGRYGPCRRYLPLEDLIGAHLPELFAGFEIRSHALYRVTRHGGVKIPTDAPDLLRAVEAATRSARAGAAVRLQVDHRADEKLRRRLVDKLGLGKSDVYAVHGLLGVGDLASLGVTMAPPGQAARQRGETRRLSWSESEADQRFAPLDGRDTLVHLPHDPDGLSMAAFLRRAARDPRVLAIKQTLFRPDPNGPVVRALVRAAERGTHVVALVELGARLSEQASVASARTLERAGAHVVYGLAGLQTHCTVSLVVWQDEGGEVRRYSLVATGLPGAIPDREGLVFASADPILAADITDLFNFLTGYSRPAGYRKLLVAPGSMRSELLRLIAEQAAEGPNGWIGLKLGQLVDHQMIDALYAASERGTDVEVVVTGACALRPRVSGLSENIRVLAPAGHRPETSRCFGFGRGDERVWFLSSADLTDRNLDGEVDVAVPVEDPWCVKQLTECYDGMADGAAWVLGPDGVWRRCASGTEERIRGPWGSRGIEPRAATFGP